MHSWVSSVSLASSTIYLDEEPHLTGNLLGIPFWYWVENCFAFRIVLILSLTSVKLSLNLTGCVRQLLQMSTAHLWREAFIPPDPQRCSVGLRCGDCWVQWTHCHFYETSLTWFELFDIAFSADWRWVHCSHKEEHGFTRLLSSNFGRMCELQHQTDFGSIQTLDMVVQDHLNRSAVSEILLFVCWKV